MEESKKIDLSERPLDTDREKGWGNHPGCPFIFGNEDSADKDLGEKFDVKED